MACLLTTTFFTPFCFTEAPFQGTHTRRLTAVRLVNHTSRAGRKHLLHTYSDGRMTSLNGSCHCSIYSPTRRRVEPISYHFSKCSSASVRISGFWIGPDIEDGWGFVEASVHRII